MKKFNSQRNSEIKMFRSKIKIGTVAKFILTYKVLFTDAHKRLAATPKEKVYKNIQKAFLRISRTEYGSYFSRGLFSRSRVERGGQMVGDPTTHCNNTASLFCAITYTRFLFYK